MYGKALLQGQGRYRAFNILRNATMVVYLAGICLLLALDAVQLVSVTVAWVTANLVSGAVTLAVALRGRPRASSDSDQVSRRRMFRFGIVGFLGTLSPVATFRLDQAVVGLFLSPEALGLYVAGLAFTNLPTVISRGVAMIALPEVARSTPEAQRAATRRFVWLATALSGAVVGVLILIAGELVPFLFGEDFTEAVTLTRILLIGSIFAGARRVLTDSVSGSGRPGLGSLAELSSWLVLIPLLLLFAPLWGTEGVAAALTVTSAISLLVLIVLVRRSDDSGIRQRATATAMTESMGIE
jgi:O-antigen/teichoic acid export membrane protein